MNAGILTHLQIDELLESGAVHAQRPWDDVQRQPASLDLRLGTEALAIRAGFLPGAGSVADRADPLIIERLDLRGGALLTRGCVYLVRLLEELRLPDQVSARANPRSSTGRIDVFTRTVVDGHGRFDDIPAGYHGAIWLEVVPRSFDIRVTTGQRLNQVRFVRGTAQAVLLSDEDLRRRLRDDRLVLSDEPGSPLPEDALSVHASSLLLGLSLRPERPGAPIGWRARDDAPVLDLAQAAGHAPLEFFDAVQPDADGALVLHPESFYILASAQRLRVPPDLAAEMLAWDVGMGELRTNYAGFFDSGFGWTEHGARAVLEVRPHDVPFQVEHGQPIFRLQFSRTVEPCRRLYGEAGSAYQGQGLALARYFHTPN